MRSVWLVQVQCVTWRKTAAMRLAHLRRAALKCPGAWTAFMEILKQASCSVLFLIGSLILPTKKKKRKKAFLSRLPPTVSRRGERKVRFFFYAEFHQQKASPLLEASLIEFPYKYQSRQLGFSSVFPLCFRETDTVWKRNDQIKWDGGGSRQSQSVADAPIGRLLWTIGNSLFPTGMDLQKTFPPCRKCCAAIVLSHWLFNTSASSEGNARLGHNYLTQSSPNEDVHIVSFHSGRFLCRVLKLGYAFLLVHIKFRKTVGKRAFMCRYHIDNDNYCIPLLIAKYCMPGTVLCISTAHKQGWNKLRKGWE